MVGAEEEQQLKNRSPRQPLFTVTWSADFVTHKKDGSKRDWLTSVLVNSIRTSQCSPYVHIVRIGSWDSFLSLWEVD